MISGQRFIVGVWMEHPFVCVANESRQRFEIHPFDGHSATLSVLGLESSTKKSLVDICTKGPNIGPFGLMEPKRVDWDGGRDVMGRDEKAI